MSQESSLITKKTRDDLELLNLVPPDARFVLEISSEDHHHAAIFNRRNPQGKYINIKTAPATGYVSDQQLDDAGFSQLEVFQVDELYFEIVGCM